MVLHKYPSLIKLPTQYAKRMQYLSNRIFGEVGELTKLKFNFHIFNDIWVFFLARPSTSKGMKVVKLLEAEPYNKRDYIINWYPRHVETNKLTMELRNLGLFRDEHMDWVEEMKRLRYLRGKIPPKRGEGKRAKLK